MPTLNIVQVSFFLDPLRRDPDTLLDVWPTLSAVANAVLGAGVQCTIVQASWSRAERQRDGVRYQFVRERRPAGLRFAGRRVPPLPRRAVSEVSALAPDVVHVHGLSFPVQTSYLARALPGVPILAQDHADHPRRGWRRSVQRWGLAPLAGVAFTAAEQARPFVETGVLRSGIPVFEVLESSSTFTPGARDVARMNTGLSGSPCLLWLGHLDENKDPLTTLDALSLAASALKDPHLWCCFRSAPLRTAVEQRIADDPVLRDRVHLLGMRRHAEVEELLRAADFLIQGSHAEGSGYAVIEALGCGTTPIVTDIPSFRRITGNGRAGALVPPGDGSAMAQALIDWAGRDRRALRETARSHFERELSFESLGKQLRTAYEALAEGA